MEMNEFIRKPFLVEAVEITIDNIEAVAEFVGKIRHTNDGTPFIQVDKRLVPNVFRVYPGFWMTRMGDNIRCYSRRVFLDQFVRMEAKYSEFLLEFESDDTPYTEAPTLA